MPEINEEALQKMTTETSRARLAFDVLTQSIDEATRTIRRISFMIRFMIADSLEAEYMKKGK